MGPGARSADTPCGNTGGTVRSAAGPYGFNSEAGSARNQPQDGRKASPARSFLPLSGKTAPCTVPALIWLTMRAEHLGFPATLVRTLYTEKNGPATTHVKRPRGRRGRREALPPMGQPHGGGTSPNRTETNPPPCGWPIQGRAARSAPPPPGPTNHPPHTHRTLYRNHDHQPAPPQEQPHSSMCARGTPKEEQTRHTGRKEPAKGGHPRRRKYLNNGRGTKPKATHTGATTARPRKRNEPNTRPHHRRGGNSRASNQPAPPGQARDDPPTPPHGKGRWARPTRDRPQTRRPRSTAGGTPPSGPPARPPETEQTGRPGHPAERSGAGDSIAKPPHFLTAFMDGSGHLYLILGHYYVTTL